MKKRGTSPPPLYRRELAKRTHPWLERIGTKIEHSFVKGDKTNTLQLLLCFAENSECRSKVLPETSMYTIRPDTVWGEKARDLFRNMASCTMFYQGKGCYSSRCGLVEYIVI